MKKWINWSIFGLVGLLLAIGTLLFHYFVLPIAIHYQVTKTLALVNGTEAWDRFVNTPIPVILNVYFFNVDNPDGVLQGEKPKLTQVGPYVYSFEMCLERIGRRSISEWTKRKTGSSTGRR